MTWSVLVLLLAAAASADYCDLDSCRGKPHTMCTYPTGGASSSCSSVYDRGTSAADRSAILNAHNALRQAVANGDHAGDGLPAAASMPDLTWDSELATVAQRWADQCVWAHDKCRNVPRFYVGQNMAATWGYAKDWAARAVQQWFDEIEDFQQDSLVFTSGTDPVSGGVIGHFTQVIWAATTKVGCGYISTEDSGYVKRVYICNYGPGGNILGQKIYEEA